MKTFRVIVVCNDADLRVAPEEAAEEASANAELISELEPDDDMEFGSYVGRLTRLL